MAINEFYLPLKCICKHVRYRSHRWRKAASIIAKELGISNSVRSNPGVPAENAQSLDVNAHFECFIMYNNYISKRLGLIYEDFT